MRTWLSGLSLAALVIWRMVLRWRRPPSFVSEHYNRVRDIHGMVHLAKSSVEPLGWVACGYERNHLTEEVDGIAIPGQRLDGTVCPLCLKIMRPDL